MASKCVYTWVDMAMFCHTHDSFLRRGEEPLPCPVAWALRQVEEKEELLAQVREVAQSWLTAGVSSRVVAEEILAVLDAGSGSGQALDEDE